MKISATRPVLAAPCFLWLMAAFAAPLGAVALLSAQEAGELFAPLSLNSSALQYIGLATDPFSRRAILRTLALGACVTYAEASCSLENTINAISAAFILLTVALLPVMHRLVPLDRAWRR